MFHKQDARMARLADVGLFAACSKAELRELAKITTELEAEAGTILCTEGTPGLTCYVVMDGIAKVTIGGNDIDSVGPGGFFGEMALLDGGPRVATVTAVTEMHLLVLSRSELSRLLTDVPSVSRKMLTAVGARLRVAHSQMHPGRVGV